MRNKKTKTPFAMLSDRKRQEIIAKQQKQQGHAFVAGMFILIVAVFMIAIK